MKLLVLLLLVLLVSLLALAGHKRHRQHQSAAPVQIVRSPWAARAPKTVRRVENGK